MKEISFERFTESDLTIGKILEVELVPKTSKLYKMQVDLGKEVRTIVSGVAMEFTPEELMGQSVLVVTNLEPRVIRGIESRGMILFASNTEGKLSYLTTSSPTQPGALVN